MRSSITIGVLAVLMLSVFALSPGMTRDAEAYIDHRVTRFPSSFNESFSVNDGAGIVTDGSISLMDWYYHTPNNPSDVVSPGVAPHYGGLYARHWDLTTNDFTNPIVIINTYQGFNVSYSHALKELPPSNATITKVRLVIYFEGAVPSMSNLKSSFSTDGTNWVTNLPVYHDGEIEAYVSDVTSLRAWTPAMLKSHDMSVSMRIYCPAVPGTYKIDYLGYCADWTLPTGGDPDEPWWWPGGGDGTMNNTTAPDVTPPFGDIPVLSLMGMIGFGGMIAIPAGSIWMAQRSDQPRMILGLQAMIAFVVCLGLFLAAI